MYDTTDHRKIAEFAQKRFGKTYTGRLLEGMKEYHEAEIETTDELVPILNTRYDQRGNPIYLDLSEKTLGGAQPIVIFAPQGAGKTVFLAALVQELLKANYCVINLSDVKNDAFFTSGRLQPQFRKFLPPWRDEPYVPKEEQAMKVRCYSPEFITRKSNPLGLKSFQMSISDFSVDDMVKSFFQLDANDPQARILRKVYNYIFKIRPPNSTEELMNAIQNVNLIQPDKNIPMSIYTRPSIQTLNDKIDMYRNEGVFGEQYSVDIIADMINKYYVSICFNNETRETTKNILQGYISALIWKIYKEKVSGRLKTKKIVEIFDDASEVAYPPRKIPSSKDSILSMARIGRDKWIFPIIVTQSVSELGRQLINKSRYVIFFSGISGSDLEFLAKERMTDYGQILDAFERGKGPEKIFYGEYEGARSVLIWCNDGSHGGRGSTIKGWVGMPSCSIPLPKMGR